MSVKVVLILSCVLSFAVQRGISLWLLLEINFVSFVGLLGARKSSCEKTRALNYFLVQALGRRLMLVSLVFLIGGVNFLFRPLFFCSILLKLGGAPLHNWYLKLVQKLSWPFIWILSCWQKLVPLLLISRVSSTYLLPARLFSLVVGRAGVVLQTSLKKLFALSSIFTLGWLLASILANFYTWVVFFGGYALNLGVLVACAALIFSRKNRQGRTRIDSVSTATLFGFLLVIRGLPPFLGFFLKISVLVQLALHQVTLVLPLALVVLSLFIIYMYIVIIFNALALTNSGDRKLTIRPRALRNIYNFFILNTGLRVILINFWLCK
jgi:NADH:ubiquinone oxidoreductase subunit 2 (subunit N)